MSNPRFADVMVSVIVPTYKRRDYLLITLRSILAQTHSNLELLVVSDGHDPDTQSLVDGLNDSRVQYLFTEHAGFPAVPRNEGLRQSSGELLAFCDDDDVWHPTKLQAQIPVLLDGSYSMCTTDYEYVDQDGKTLDLENFFSEYYGELSWKTFFPSMGFICNAAVLFTRETYEKIGGLNENPALRAHEDYEYWMRVLFENRGYFMEQKLVSYRIHRGSIQKNSPGQVLKSRLILHRHLKRLLPIPFWIRSRKYLKLLSHYGFDKYPMAKALFRRAQRRQN